MARNGTGTARLRLQGEFKNRRKTRSRRGNEAEVFFALKSASLGRRLRFLIHLYFSSQSTSISFAALGTEFVVDLPPGQRT
jgi:hypothetical protein